MSNNTPGPTISNWYENSVKLRIQEWKDAQKNLCQEVANIIGAPVEVIELESVEFGDYFVNLGFFCDGIIIDPRKNKHMLPSQRIYMRLFVDQPEPLVSSSLLLYMFYQEVRDSRYTLYRNNAST